MDYDPRNETDKNSPSNTRAKLSGCFWDEFRVPSDFYDMKSKAITAQTTPPTGYTLFLAFTKDLSEKWGHAINGNSIWVSLPWSLQGDWTEASNRLRLLQNAATGSSEISKKSSIASMAPKAEMLLQSAIALKPAKARKRQFKRHPTTNQYAPVVQGGKAGSISTFDRTPSCSGHTIPESVSLNESVRVGVAYYGTLDEAGYLEAAAADAAKF